jgi:predicted DNA-binding transcriptional regulator AlpA
MIRITPVIVATDQGPALLSCAEARRISGGISRATQARLIAAGDYPQPIVLSVTRHGKHARVAWVESEVRAWVARRISASRRPHTVVGPQDVLPVVSSSANRGEGAPQRPLPPSA